MNGPLRSAGSGSRSSCCRWAPARRRAKARGDHVRRHRGLDEGLAGGAHPFAADVAFDAEGARGVVAFLGHVLTDALHLTAAGTGGAMGFVVDLGAGQLPVLLDEPPTQGTGIQM